MLKGELSRTYLNSLKFVFCLKIHTIEEKDNLAMSDIQEKIAEEVEQAHNACNIYGDTSKECAAAWDAVEELQAEASHQRGKQAQKTSLERYCDDNPDADECRIYDD